MVLDGRDAVGQECGRAFAFLTLRLPAGDTTVAVAADGRRRAGLIGATWDGEEVSP